MADTLNIIGRSDLAPQMIPDQEVTEILKMAPEQSVMLANAKRVQMSSQKYKQPVLATLPEAYWVDGDTGLKETTKADWQELTITAEELAVIVPIPPRLTSGAKSVRCWLKLLVLRLTRLPSLAKTSLPLGLMQSLLLLPLLVTL